MEGEGGRPRAVFMAFGTKGDVYPIAAIASALSCDRKDYDVILITHSAHKSLAGSLEARGVHFIPVSTPAVLSRNHGSSAEDSGELPFSMQKKAIRVGHRKECLSAVEGIFGDGPSLEGDFILINFFALEGWNLAELFQVCCVVAAPYVVPYSAPSSFERQFKDELPLLHRHLQESPLGKVCWSDVIHWMWPLFTEDWGSWRSDSLNLSPIPFTDPVTCLPSWSSLEQSPLLLYGFSKEVVECPGYWPPNVHACGFWFLPMDWQFSCAQCRERMLHRSAYLTMTEDLCSSHVDLEHFMKTSGHSCRPIFVGLSSIGSMGYIVNPRAFLLVLKAVTERTGQRFILFSSGYETLDAAIRLMADELPNPVQTPQSDCAGDFALLHENRLFCFSGNVPYSWLFPKCAAVIHHGGSGSTAAAVAAGVPQVVCPFVLDQFYWAERMHWLGLAPEPLQKGSLVPEDDDAATIERGACAVMRAIESALSPDVRSHAAEMAERVSMEDGIAAALKILEQQVLRPRGGDG
ncbi:unnamed protein product [Spirodela intermedia]|uniref:Erythromycin biosynthesis protein CIII-like C-terminal domain-containing protein n=1 Tax=Spirodela intermedia TaxID=51605 RepID=A0A7I8KJD7_SPIIN|nr:unnamed protein product [Spirodela intermedia]